MMSRSLLTLCLSLCWSLPAFAQVTVAVPSGEPGHPLAVQIASSNGQDALVKLELVQQGQVSAPVTGRAVGGAITFTGIPALADALVTLEHAGARFPFSVPAGAKAVTLAVPEVQTDLSVLRLERLVYQLSLAEEGLWVRQRLEVVNTGAKAVDPTRGEDGGLAILAPSGAKDLGVSDELDGLVEAHGGKLLFRGIVLPGERVPLDFFYRVPLKRASFELSQTLPLPSGPVTVVAPRGLAPGQRQGELKLQGPAGETAAADEQLWLLRLMNERGAGEAIRFTVAGIPAEGTATLIGVVAAIAGLGMFMLLGLKPLAIGGGISLSTLTAERDQLLRALGRMKRAAERGRLKPHEHQREREAILARLTTLYTAMDHLEKR